MFWGLSEALSVTTRLPESDPVTVGVKLMLTEQLAPAARLAPQLFVDTEKGAAAETLTLFNIAPLVFVSFTATDREVLMVCDPKATLAGEKERFGL